LGQLGEALLCLASQSFQDFEVLIVGHSLTQGHQKAVSELLESLPFSFLDKIRFDVIRGGPRAAPLNHALGVATGQYFTFLDDDDLVFSNWLETFHALSLKSPGRVLRSQAAEQEYSVDPGNPNISRAESAMRTPYNPEFSLVEHLIQNQSPFMTLAFPRGLYDHLGMKFNDSLSTTEDWDYLLRASGILGVENSETVTAVYRKWKNLESSSSIKSREWSSNEALIRGNLNLIPLILPHGEVNMVSSIVERHAENKFRSILEQHDADMRANFEAHMRERDEAFHALVSSLESRSWRWTKPARGVVNLLKRRRPFSLRSIDLQDVSAIQRSTELIQGSIWWKITKALRRK
jgi:glycosyltransferase involved in cell wall biosynthesis